MVVEFPHMTEFHEKGPRGRIEDDALVSQRTQTEDTPEDGNVSWEALNPKQKLRRGVKEFQKALKAREEVPGVNSFVDPVLSEERLPLVLVAVEEIAREGTHTDVAQVALTFENLAAIIGSMDFKMSERGVVEDKPTLEALHTSLLKIEQGVEAIVASSGGSVQIRGSALPLLGQLDEAARILKGKLETSA